MTFETLKRLEELNERWANEPDNCPGTMQADCIASEVMDRLPDLIAAVKERDAALKACAEMRSVLELVRDPAPGIFESERGHFSKLCDHALSTDCGKDYIHKREIEPLVEALKSAKPLLAEFEKRTLRGDLAERASKSKTLAKQALAQWEKVKEETK